MLCLKSHNSGETRSAKAKYNVKEDSRFSLVLVSSFDTEVYSFYIYIYIYGIVTGTLRPTKVHRARRISKDSQFKPHSKHERRELRKMRGWTTSDVKKIKNLTKMFRSETFFSYLQLWNKKEP